MADFFEQPELPIDNNASEIYTGSLPDEIASELQNQIKLAKLVYIGPELEKKIIKQVTLAVVAAYPEAFHYDMSKSRPERMNKINQHLGKIDMNERVTPEDVENYLKHGDECKINSSAQVLILGKTSLVDSRKAIELHQDISRKHHFNTIRTSPTQSMYYLYQISTVYTKEHLAEKGYQLKQNNADLESTFVSGSSGDIHNLEQEIYMTNTVLKNHMILERVDNPALNKLLGNEAPDKKNGAQNGNASPFDETAVDLAIRPDGRVENKSIQVQPSNNNLVNDKFGQKRLNTAMYEGNQVININLEQAHIFAGHLNDAGKKKSIQQFNNHDNLLAFHGEFNSHDMFMKWFSDIGKQLGITDPKRLEEFASMTLEAYKNKTDNSLKVEEFAEQMFNQLGFGHRDIANEETIMFSSFSSFSKEIRADETVTIETAGQDFEHALTKTISTKIEDKTINVSWKELTTVCKEVGYEANEHSEKGIIHALDKILHYLGPRDTIESLEKIINSFEERLELGLPVGTETHIGQLKKEGANIIIDQLGLSALKDIVNDLRSRVGSGREKDLFTGTMIVGNIGKALGGIAGFFVGDVVENLIEDGVGLVLDRMRAKKDK